MVIYICDLSGNSNSVDTWKEGFNMATMQICHKDKYCSDGVVWESRHEYGEIFGATAHYSGTLYTQAFFFGILQCNEVRSSYKSMRG